MQNGVFSITAATPRCPVRRGAIACLQCRSRKVKCDSNQPSCTRCQTDEKQCEYRKSRRGGRPRQTAIANNPAQSQALPLSINRSDTLPTDSSSSWSDHAPPQSGSDTQPLPTSLDTTRIDIPGVNSIQADQLLSQYYHHFHEAHPFVLPKPYLLKHLFLYPDEMRVLLISLLYIGSIYTASVPSAPLAEASLQAIESARAAVSLNPYYLQALIVYGVAVYWNDESKRGREIHDDAISVAYTLGMHRSGFAGQYGKGDPVLEESWRRTWWQLYVIDACIAGSYHIYPPKTCVFPSTAELPCEEDLYQSGAIPQDTRHTLKSYDMREFSDAEFSSFAHLVGFTHAINRVIEARGVGDPVKAKQICNDVDTIVTAWCSLLPTSKRRILRDDGTVDQLIFTANILMNTYIVDLHRELSTLEYSDIESTSKCAPPPPHKANHMIKEDAHIHTSKVLFALEKLNSLLTLPTRLATHTPFMICMISNMTIAHLSACRFHFKEPALQTQRDRIRLTMGVLKMFGEYWKAGKREYRDVGTIARVILDVRDEHIELPKEAPILPMDALDFNFDFDANWGYDCFASGAAVLPMDSFLSC